MPATKQDPGARRKHWTVFAVSAALSLVLSPITAIWAVLIGALGFAATVAFPRTTPVAAAFAGITTGALPYIVAGLIT